MSKAIILFANGPQFLGTSFGAEGEAVAEMVFNTSITGYQEILTDPSYCGQFVTMTYPLIGNYGINEEDHESRKPFLSGMIVKEASKIVSNFRATSSLQDFMKKHKLLGVEGVDTRAITKMIREAGAMKAIVSTKDFDIESLTAKLKKAPEIVGKNLVKDVTCEKAYEWEVKNKRSKEVKKNETGKSYRVALLDCGFKYNIARELTSLGCNVTVFPASTSAEELLKGKYDGLMLSNGPGDPAAVTDVVATVKALLGKLPIFGICLGHQMLGLALGGTTYKLKFGHHGANQPVKDMQTGKIDITSQNHNYCVDFKSLGSKVEVTHINLNDNTVEGLRHKEYPLFSVQYHPEAAPGPHDSNHLFNRFIALMEKNKK
ncbi:MAG: glutamine-hydrolyzing carbamoyl-phosphate synthase small subunit [Candidatus Margulisiibacteriota bacterium]|jgi:carbamoyl-phosphate synthase small subunit